MTVTMMDVMRELVRFDVALVLVLAVIAVMLLVRWYIQERRDGGPGEGRD